MKRYQWISLLAILSLLLSMAGNPTGFALASGGASSAQGQSVSGAPDFALGFQKIITAIRQWMPFGDISLVYDLRIRKIADAEVVNAGDPIGFTILVGATGQQTLHNVVVTDQLDPELGWTENSNFCSIDSETGLMTCSFGTMTPGSYERVHLSAMTDSHICGTLTNTAYAVADGGHNRSETATINVVCQPNVTVDKVAETATILPGDTARYSLVVSNIGDGMASDVTLVDTLPVNPGLDWDIDSADGECQIDGGVLSCSFGNLPSDAVRTVVISSPTTLGTCGDINNSALVSASNQQEIDRLDDSASETITVSCSTLMVEKLADNDVVNGLEEIGFTLTVTNTGLATATNVTLSDQLAAGMTWVDDSDACSINGSNLLICSFGNLAPEASASVHVTGMATPAVCGEMSNTAVVQAANLPGSVSDTAAVMVNCAPDLSVTKVADDTTVGPGDPVSFLLTVTNSGSAAAESVLLTDPLPPNTELTWVTSDVTEGGMCDIVEGVLSCSFGDLPAGETAMVRVSAVTTTQTCGSLVNTVTVEAANALTVVTDVAAIDVHCTPNVTITKTAERFEVRAGNAGEPARFTITATSNGNGTVNNVLVTDVLPGGRGLVWSIDPVADGEACEINAGVLTCNFGNLPSGESRSVVISSPTSQEFFCLPTVDITISNTVSVTTANEPPESLADNVANATVNVLCTGQFCEAPDTVYTNDFNTGTPGSTYWTNYKTTTSPNGTQTFLGEMNNEDVFFNYEDTDPFGHVQVVVAFDLYIMKSWDGNNVISPRYGDIIGPDLWSLELQDGAGNPVRDLVNTTFANFEEFSHVTQSYPKPAFMGDFPAKTGSFQANDMGYSFYGPRSSTYRFYYSFPHTDQNIRLAFRDDDLQSLRDESWGIDNFEMTIIRCATGFALEYNYYMPVMGFQTNMAGMSPTLDKRTEEE